MRFDAAAWLWLLLAVAGLAAAYVVVQRQRKRYAVRFTNLDLLASLAPRHPGWRRHLPAAGLALALGLLVLALADPSRSVKVPRERATVIMAIDVSVSMQATDVEPTRLTAARSAAEEFVRKFPRRFRLGLVAFAGTAQVLVPPTTDRELILNSVANLRLAPSTAIGEAIFASLDTIASVPGSPGQKPPPARVVLMSDGFTTSGRSNVDAAMAAREAGVRVSTIAFGTETGTVEVQGESFPVPVDKPALREIAELTNGSFFEAASGDQLRQVYEDIGSSIGYLTERRSVASWFVGAGLALALLAAAGSLVWTSRLP